MLGAYKKHPQAYLLYVEDCFLLSDNADASYISKGLVDGTRQHIQLLLSGKLYKVYRITGYTDGQLWILFGIFHRIFQ